jgi:hypothetical protein
VKLQGSNVIFVHFRQAVPIWPNTKASAQPTRNATADIAKLTGITTGQ